ncbi:MAG: kinase [Desulfovibrionaceae bacterium]|nr:kinase [Desulfovibrionaceae bacterium]
MVICRTPFRISFFGGGTDYPSWYLEHGGSVLATAINKYCYITCRYLPPFFEHRLRVVWSRIENVQTYRDIQHPAVREVLRFLDFERGLEIHHDGDLPARSGMGSSSSFVVGLLHALYALKGEMPGKHRLAMEGIRIEQDMIKETVGSQDQVSAAYGGLNHIVFHRSGEITVRPVTLTRERIEELDSHLMLFYTGIKRTASDVAKSYVDDLEARGKQLDALNGQVDRAIEILSGNKCICGFGELLHQAWTIKRTLSDMVSSEYVDGLYQKALDHGAIGGKITGAGGGGFLLLFVPPSAQDRVRRALKDLLHVPFKFQRAGSEIIFYELEREDYSQLDLDRPVHGGR